MTKFISALVAISAGLTVSSPAFAHPGHDLGGGFAAGIMHPLTGTDHLAAMLLVGLWAGLLARRTRWQIPTAFLVAMLAGFFAASPGLTAMTEPLILLSLLALGMAAALHWRAPAPLAAAIVALFGYAHGQAHGFETPHGAMPLVFALGFLLSSAAVQGIGLWLARKLPVFVSRAAGVAGMGLGLTLALAGGA